MDASSNSEKARSNEAADSPSKSTSTPFSYSSHYTSGYDGNARGSPIVTSPLKQVQPQNPASRGKKNKNKKNKNTSANTSVPTSVPIPDRGFQVPNTKMDPFEVRVRFTAHLQHLNASVTSANKAAQYALKYRDMDEDLHSCILEQLERNSMNNRANIMYFIEHLCDMATREGHADYVRMMQRDILRIVDAVAPEDGSGAANVKVVRKVLQALQQKTYLLAQTVSEIEECLKERDVAPDTLLSSPLADALDSELGNGNGTAPTSQTPKPSKSTFSGPRLDKKQIEQRIEEDRERHKKLRENIWAVNSTDGLGGIGGGTKGKGKPYELKPIESASEVDAEFERLWEETSDVGEDDYDQYEEEAKERREAAKEWKEERKRFFNGET